MAERVGENELEDADFDDTDFDDSDFDDSDFDDTDLEDDGADEAATPGTVFTYDASLAPTDPAILDLLRHGDIAILGRMPWSSNGTFLVDVTRGGDHAPAIYKPHRGERPLWDFPSGLWKREVASYELSRSMGFDLVPPTVIRTAGPLDEGSLQAFVPANFDEHYFTINDRPEFGDALRRLCAFDLVANSADRKGGHCLVDGDDRLWAIDNGLTFHAEFKVRTVIWEFAGETLPADVVEALVRLLDCGLSPEVAELLDVFERDAVLTRARALLSNGRFMHDTTGRRYPWPMV